MDEAARSEMPSPLEEQKKLQEKYITETADPSDDEFDFDIGDERSEPSKPAGEAGSQTASDPDANLSDAEIDSVVDGELKAGDQPGQAQALTPPAPPPPPVPAVAAPPSPPTPSPQAAAPQPPQPGEQPPAPAAQVAAPPVGEQTPPAAPVEAPQLPEASGMTPDEIQSAYKSWRKASEDTLAEHHYGLSQDDIVAFDTEPAKVIPRLMSRVYLDAVTAAIGQITTHLPRLVSTVIESNKKLDESSERFFEAWPVLKEHHEEVIRQGMVFRNFNPTATEKEFIDTVGAAVCLAKRIDPNAVRPAQTQGQLQPALPVGSNIPGFAPAAMTAPPIAGPRAPANPWEQVNQEFSEDIGET